MPRVESTVDWLLESGEPWTRYRALRDLLGKREDDPDVRASRQKMLRHPHVRALIQEAASWPHHAFKRHNDAAYPIYALSTLSDFGLRHDDRGMKRAVQAVMKHRAPEGAFQSLVNIPQAFGGSGEDTWTWIACDAPTLAYALAGLGLDDHAHVRAALDHVAALGDENGWRCRAAPELGRFKGPGKRSDPCPIANVYALKALATEKRLRRRKAVRAGIETLLWHWEHGQSKPFLFGVGSDFRKLKYPLVWYDVLHVADVLSRYPEARRDPRFVDMVGAITRQADGEGRYTATSMYRAWKGWSFADKKQPSPWLTFLVRRIEARLR